MVLVGAQRPSIHGHDNVNMEAEEADDIRTDRIGSRVFSRDTDLLTCHDCVEVAGM